MTVLNVSLTDAERAEVFRDSVCLQHKYAFTSVCRGCQAAGDEVIERILTARLADVWDAAAEATVEWIANNPHPSGIPQDPPRNPYREDP